MLNFALKIDGLSRCKVQLLISNAMAESTVVYTPENNGGSVPAWMLANNGGLFGNGNGWGGGILGFLLGLFFGNGWGGFGGWGGGFGNNGGAGFLSNQINNDSGRELLMNAINSNGEASRAAVSSLSTMLGQDFNLVNSGVSAIRDGIAALTAQTGMSALQIINAIQSGNASLASDLCRCCCENKLLVTSQGYENQIATLNQTNTLASAISGGNQKIVDAISDLKTTTIAEFCSARERDMQSKIDTQSDIITQLRNQISNDKQTEAFTSAFNAINQKLVDLAAKTPNTVPVQWPALTAVNTTPYVNGGYYGSAFGFGNGVTF